MRKIREVLRLHSLGLSQRQIAVSCAVGQATVSDYLKAAEAAGLKWPDIADWGEDRLMEASARSRGNPGNRKQPTDSTGPPSAPIHSDSGAETGLGQVVPTKINSHYAPAPSMS